PRWLPAPNVLSERRRCRPARRHGRYPSRIWHLLQMVSILHRFALASMDALVQLLSPLELRLALFHEGAAALAKILAVHAGKADLFDRVHVALVGILQYLRNGDLGRLNGEWRIA